MFMPAATTITKASKEVVDDIDEFGEFDDLRLNDNRTLLAEEKTLSEAAQSAF